MAEVCGAHDARVGTSKQCGNCRRPQDGAAKRRAAGTVAVLDGQVMQRQRQQPAGQQIDGAAVLNFTRRYLGHYVSFPSEAALVSAVAWIGHAVARDRDDKGIGQLIWRASPRLLATSRKRQSGKSTLLDLIAILTRARDGKSPKITPRAIAETVGQHYDVAVLDEAKTIFGSGAKNLELQGCLLAGYTPRTSYRVSGKSIPLFGAVAYAGKDELIRDTTGEQIGDLLDRSIILRFSPPATVPPRSMRSPRMTGNCSPPRWSHGPTPAATSSGRPHGTSPRRTVTLSGPGTCGRCRYGVRCGPSAASPTGSPPKN